MNKIRGFNGSINFVFDNFNIIFNNSCGSAINLINSFSNIGIGGGDVKPLDFKLPEGMATCKNSCKMSSGKDYKDPKDPNNDSSNHLDQFYITIDVNKDIKSNGHFSDETKKELEKGGLNSFQIQTLEIETEWCKYFRKGAKLSCWSTTDPRNKDANCCLECSCLTSKDYKTGRQNITICEDYWIIK